MMVQAIIIYYFLPGILSTIFKIDHQILNEILSVSVAGVITVTLNTTAYLTEVLRGGINSVDKGQSEAAQALGLGKVKTMMLIVFPQALKNSLPSIGNELIMVIKETSLASTVNVAIGELMSVQNQIKADSYIVLEPFFIIAIMYFIVTFSLSKVVRLIERRLETHD